MNDKELLESLLEDPKHNGKDVAAEAQTRNDDLRDPQHNKADGAIDQDWKQGPDGLWNNPNFR